MSVQKLEWEPTELLATAPVAEPIVLKGVHLHGGLDENGNYVSPRNRFRMQAIRSWQSALQLNGGAMPSFVPEELAPQVPSLEQAKFLFDNGIYEPFLATLTRVGIVEGYGALLRHLVPQDLQSYFVEDISHLALGHLSKGLVEAHARDESGFEKEAGHSQMWPLARDLGFPSLMSREEVRSKVELCLERASAIKVGSIGRSQERLTHLPEELLELLDRLIGVLLIEIRAYVLFSWAEELFRYCQAVADSEWPLRIVGFIRQDETPHVEYLKTVLGEISLLHIRGKNGSILPGSEVVSELLDRQVKTMLGPGHERNVRTALSDLSVALTGRSDGEDIWRGFLERSSEDLSVYLGQPPRSRSADRAFGG